MTDGQGRRYIRGYFCPDCGNEESGIEIPDRSGWRSRIGWWLRVRDRNDLRVQCSSCGADVPRKHWHYDSTTTS